MVIKQHNYRVGCITAREVSQSKRLKVRKVSADGNSKEDLPSANEHSALLLYSVRWGSGLRWERLVEKSLGWALLCQPLTVNVLNHGNVPVTLCMGHWFTNEHTNNSTWLAWRNLGQEDLYLRPLWRKMAGWQITSQHSYANSPNDQYYLNSSFHVVDASKCEYLQTNY